MLQPLPAAAAGEVDKGIAMDTADALGFREGLSLQKKHSVFSPTF